eukprot:139666-Amorphochlora_amoeboformis.AAC.1
MVPARRVDDIRGILSPVGRDTESLEWAGGAWRAGRMDIDGRGWKMATSRMSCGVSVHCVREFDPEVVSRGVVDGV